MGTQEITQRAYRWLQGDDKGLSSETMCWYFLTGHAPRRLHGFFGPCAPLDPDDLGRCLRLLEQFPEWASRVSEMASLSPEWAALAAVWAELTTLYREELPAGRAPRCYNAMKKALEV